MIQLRSKHFQVRWLIPCVLQIVEALDEERRMKLLVYQNSSSFEYLGERPALEEDEEEIEEASAFLGLHLVPKKCHS